MTLDQAIFVEDAIEAISEGVTRQEYVDMHHSKAKSLAGDTFESALNEIKTHGTARKALNFVRRIIESYR